MFDGAFGKVLGKVFRDRGCLGYLGYLGKNPFDWRMGQGLKLVTPLRKNMKNALMPMDEKLQLRKRLVSKRSTITSRTSVGSSTQGIAARRTAGST